MHCCNVRPGRRSTASFARPPSLPSPAGGLLDEPRAGQAAGQVVLGGADAYGLPPRKRPGSVLRSQVADCCVAALVEPSASGKVVEIIAEQGAPPAPFTELFASV